MNNIECKLFCDGWLAYVNMPFQPRIGERITYEFKDYEVTSIRYSFDFNDFKYVVVGLKDI